MFKYSRFDFDIKKNKKHKVILLSLIIFIIIILLIINININYNTKNDIKIISSNSRRIINDLNSLNNYTETMSDYLVSNTNYYDNNINEKQLKELEKIKILIEYFKKKEEEISIINITKQNEISKLIKKEKAFNLIKSYIPNYNKLINLVPRHYNNYEGYNYKHVCLKDIINFNNEELFNKLINIDYENMTVSFNYLDTKNKNNKVKEHHIYENYDNNNKYYKYDHIIYHNFKENIIKNPIYQIIKENLEIDYSYNEFINEYINKQNFNNRSKYNYNDYNSIHNAYHSSVWNKYYDNISNNIRYTYYYYSNNNNMYYDHYYYKKFHDYREIIIDQSLNIAINNPNIINRENPYKYICGSLSMQYYYPKFTIEQSNYETYSYYKNINFARDYSYVVPISVDLLKDLLNCDCNKYQYCHDAYTDKFGYYYYSNQYYLYLDSGKGSRMYSNNLTNNLPPLSYNYNDLSYINCKVNEYCIFDYIQVLSNYFNNRVDVNIYYPLIYTEYEYIELLIKDIVNIYELPIIPPINFM